MGAKCAKCQKRFVSKAGELCYNCQHSGATVTPVPHALDWLSSPESTDPLNRTDQPSAGMVGDLLDSRTPTTHSDYRQSNGGAAERCVDRQICGSVANYRSQCSAPVFPVRWFYSLAFGVQFCLRPSMQVFQLVTGDVDAAYGAPACCEVVIYGGAHTGAISDGNMVAVSGCRNRRGTVIARRIVNQSTHAELTVRPAIPAWLVWLITLGLCWLCVWISRAVQGGVSWMHDAGQRASGAASESGNTLILLLILVAALAWYIMARIREFRRRRRSGMPWAALGIFLLVLCLMLPQIGPLVLILGAMVYLIKILLTGR